MDSVPPAGAPHAPVNTPGAPGVQTAERFGQQLAQGGSSVMNIAQRDRDLEIADQLMSAEQKLKDGWSKFMDNAQTTRMGVDSWGVTKDAEKWFADQRDQIDQTLDSAEAKRKFGQVAGAIQGAGMDSVRGFEREQRHISLVNRANASIDSSINMAAAAADTANEDKVVSESLDDINRRIHMVGAINGWSDEEIANKKNAATTKLYSAIVAKKADRNAEDAKTYYQDHKDSIDGVAQVQLEKLLETSSQLHTAQTFADDAELRGLDPEKARAEARKKYDGETEKAVISEINSREAQKAAEAQKQQMQYTDQAFQIYSQAKKLSAIPAAVLNGMDGKSRLALQKQNQCLS